MAPGFVDRMRGSKWQSAQLTGSAGKNLPENFREIEEIDRSNVWRSISCAVRRQQVAVGPADLPG